MTITTSRAPSVLHHAIALLDGRASLRGSVAVRAAALLARQELEQLVRERCRASGCAMDRATERSRLVVLRRLDGPEFADLAVAAWHGLSRACHHHAYELPPSAADVRHWLDNVIKLKESARSPAAIDLV